MLEAALSLLILIGAAFVFVGSLGLVRLTDFYTRLHGPTKATTLGVGSLLIASVLFFSNQGNGLSLHEILVTLFLFITAPVSAHLLSKAALHLRVRSPTPVPSLVVDADSDSGSDREAAAAPLLAGPLPAGPRSLPAPAAATGTPTPTGAAALAGAPAEPRAAQPGIGFTEPTPVEPGPTESGRTERSPTVAVTTEPLGIRPDTVHLALCTCPDSATAERLAASLVDDGLAACVNLVPGLVSIYRWQGKIDRDAEVLLLIKTTAARLPALAEHVAQHHPYETPELIALPITAGLDPYLDWVRASTRPPTVD